MSEPNPPINPAYGEQLGFPELQDALEIKKPVFATKIAEEDWEQGPAGQAYLKANAAYGTRDLTWADAHSEPSPSPPIIKEANGNIIGGYLINNGDTPILVVQVEVGEGQIVAAGLGAEAVSNLLVATGQRNGLVHVSYNAQDMTGLTFSPRPGRI